MTEPRVFPVFATVRLGAMSIEQFVQGWESFIFGEAHRMLAQVSISPTEVDTDLVLVSGVDLGLTRRSRPSDIFACAQELGLQLCPAEVGPVLRSWYYCQNGDESYHYTPGTTPQSYWYPIAMQGIVLGGDSWVFTIERGFYENAGSVASLSSEKISDSYGKCRGDLKTKWVFVQPRR